MKDIIQFCNCKRNEAMIEYNRIKTGGNDPSITQRSRYSQLVNNSNLPCIVSYKYSEYVAKFGEPPLVIPPTKANPLFKKYYH